jgi:hypothetical protein
MVNEPLAKKIKSYADTRQLRITRKLGSGNQGTVFAALMHQGANEIAVKFHNDAEAYYREKNAYERLASHSVMRVEGFNIPELVDANDDWLVLEMTIVPKPFVLDFGGAYVDDSPEFPDDVWEHWLEQKIEMFEDRWPIVEKIISEFRKYGVHLLDVHPRNISFLDER